MFKKMIRKTKLSVALSVALTGGMVASTNVQAVNLTPDGLGDAALFSYFSAKDTWQTFVRLINTDSENAIAVKVRFREAANSREILDFIVLLSPNDMWVGWTDAKAIAGKPGLRSNDKSCIIPLVGSSASEAEAFHEIPGGMIAAQFKDRAFTGIYADGSPLSSMDRMQEGHIEVIGIASYKQGSPVYNAALHFNGVPNNCGNARDAFYASAVSGLAGGKDVGNVLAANAYMINVAAGQGGGYNPTMLANFSSPGTGGKPSSLIQAAISTDANPDLDSADPAALLTTAEEVVLSGWDQKYPPASFDYNSNSALHRHSNDENLRAGHETHRPVVTGGVDAVSSLLMRTNVMNEWAANKGASIIEEFYTQWVLTFPTKNYYVDIDTDVKTSDMIFPTLACAGYKTKKVARIIDGDKVFVTVPVSPKPVFEGIGDFSLVYSRDGHLVGDKVEETRPAGDGTAGGGDASGMTTVAEYTAAVLAYQKYLAYKKEYQCNKDGKPNNNAFAPFTNRFQTADASGAHKGMSCEGYRIDLYNREEGHVDFTSPAPSDNPHLCYETNILTFNEAYKNVGLNSKFASVVPAAYLPTNGSAGVTSTKGWANLRFSSKNAQTGLVTNNGIVLDGSKGIDGVLNRQNKLFAIAGKIGKDPEGFAREMPTVRYKGLPVDGFMFTIYKTKGGLNNHTAINTHKYTRKIYELDAAVNDKRIHGGEGSTYE